MKRYVLLKIILMTITIVFVLQCSVYADTVTAKDLVNLFNEGWEEKYDPETAALTETSVKNIVGQEVLEKIDKDYKNIKITDDDIGNLTKNEKLMLFAALYCKLEEMSPEEQNEYKGSSHFNFDALYESIGDNELDDKYQNVLKELSPNVYMQPDRTGKVNGNVLDDGLEQSMNDADEFVADGKNDKIDLKDFQTQFGDIYNIVLQIGVGLAVIVGIVLGVKFILSSVEGKAEVKKMLITYVVSCVVIFGSFGIWKIVVTILQTV